MFCVYPFTNPLFTAIILVVSLTSVVKCEIDTVNVDLIVDACNTGLDFDSIQDYLKFVETFKSLEHEHSDKIPKKCLKYKESIIELANMLSTTYVCDPSKINQLIDYHNKYFSPKLFSSKKFITYKFFEKYAVQVALTCKRNLINNVASAREELKSISKTFEQAREKVFNDEPSIKSNIESLQREPNDPTTINVKPKSQIESVLGEYREALSQLAKPEDILVFERDECLNSRYRESLVAKTKLQTFFKPALMCHQLHRYYAGSVLSIAKLANHGYLVQEPEIDLKIADDLSVKDWLIAAQLCEPLMHMSTKKIAGDIAYIDNCSEKVMAIEVQIYDDKFEDLETEKLKELVPKSRASRKSAQKLMKKALKKVAKGNILKQIRSGASKRSIFTNSISSMTGSGTPLFNMDLMNQPDTSLDLVDTSEKAVGKSSSSINIQEDLTDEQSFEILMKISGKELLQDSEEETAQDSDVQMFDPFSSLLGSLTVMAIMLSFEWIFFIVMTLAARICHSMYFNFEDILAFPPKVLSWSDANFARHNDMIEKMDEDDFFDYDELTREERQHRDLLSKVFGQPPPMLYRD